MLLIYHLIVYIIVNIISVNSLKPPEFWIEPNMRDDFRTYLQQVGIFLTSDLQNETFVK